METPSPRPMAFSCSSSRLCFWWRRFSKCSRFSRDLTIKLQSKVVDVVYPYKLVGRVVPRFKSLRHNSTSEFRKQFAEATRIGKQLHGDSLELTKPRIAGRQRHCKQPALVHTRRVQYYRITLYSEFLSHVVSELEERFLNNPSHSLTIGLLHLLPSECHIPLVSCCLSMSFILLGCAWANARTSSFMQHEREFHSSRVYLGKCSNQFCSDKRALHLARLIFISARELSRDSDMVLRRAVLINFS